MTADLSRRGLFRAFRLPLPAETISAEDRWIARIGDACVEPRGVLCRRCGDECDVRAISFRLLGHGKARASLDTEICTGCGACLPVCPTHAIERVPAERRAVAAGLANIGSVS